MSKKNLSAKAQVLKLIFEGAESVSATKNNAIIYLKEEGVNTDALLVEGIKRIKQLQLQAQALQTKREMSAFQDFRLKARALVKELMTRSDFSFASFVKKEMIPLHNRNIESLSNEDIENTLTEYYALKMFQEPGQDGV